MTPERYQRVVDLFEQASGLAPGERADFLAEACAGDEALHQEVTAMLDAAGRADAFFEQPPGDVAAAALAAQRPPLIGQKLGDYLVLSRLGAGGMGEVYLAEDTRLGRKAALKILPEEYSADQAWLRRFDQEARAASALNHPGIVTVYGVGESGTTRFLATEFVEGRTLREQMAEGPLDRQTAIAVAAQTALALAAAHRAGIVHRDIKPENIMLRPDGLVKVLDFGLAKHTPGAGEMRDVTTMPGLVMGTARYMSPEQARGQTVDARTDLFSLGVVLYEMLAGGPPFTGDTAGDVIAEILKTEPPALASRLPDASPELERIAGRALRKDRTERYQSADEMAAELKSLERLELASAPPSPGPRTPRWRRAPAMLAAALLLALSAAAGWWILHRPATETVESVAVLFVNATDDTAAQYVSDGLTEGLINDLSQLPRLTVIASSSVFHYKRDKYPDLKKVSGELKVRTILTGRVRQQGDSLVVNAELVNTRDLSRMWGEQYARKSADLQAVEAEIARAVADKLRLQLTGEQKRQLGRPGTPSPKAYDLYMTGLYLGQRISTRKKALDFFNQAIAEDPRYALPYVSIAAVYSFLGEIGEMDPKQATVRAKEAAQKALDLDPDLAKAHSAMAVVLGDEWDWAGAEREFRWAIGLNPNLSEAHGTYALLLVGLGRTPEALAEDQRAQQLDPLSINYRSYEGTILYNARRYPEALQKFQAVLQREPEHAVTHAYLGYIYSAQGAYSQAVEEFQTTIRLLPGAAASVQCYLGSVYARMGKRQEALALLDRLKQTKDYVSPAELSILYVGLGDKDNAFDTLQRAYAAHDPQMQYLNVDPHYDSLRSDPRFGYLTRLVGLTK